MTPRILAIVVLYGQRAEDSLALAALQRLQAAELEVMVWDNTPGERSAPEDFAGRYIHDGTNPGLATAYNAALQYALERGAQWLMLLDQDTAVSPDYLDEVLAKTRSEAADVFIPRLLSRGAVASPFHPVLVGPVRAMEATASGLLTFPVQAFNSCSVFSVAKLQQMGGFDTDFPIDYLDHATFAALQHSGGRISLLDATLAHELATDTGKALTDGALRRQHDILAGEARYYAKYGTPEERRATRKRQLRRIASVLFHKRDVRHAWLIFRSMVSA